MSNTDNNRPDNAGSRSAAGTQAGAPVNPTSDEIYRPQYEEDTISLIDLVAVVVRHRALIIGGTLLVGIVTAAVLYFGPMAGLEMGPQAVYTGEQRVVINPLPPEVEDFVSVDIPVTVRSILTDPPLVGDVYRRFEEDPPEDRSQERYLTMIRRNVIGERYNVSWDSNTRTITLQYTTSTSEDTVAFLEAILEMMEPEVAGSLGPRFIEAAESLEGTVERTREELAILANETLLQLTNSSRNADLPALMEAVDRAGGTTLRSLADLERAAVRLETLSEDSSALFSPVGQPVVFEETTGSSRSMVVIIATITAFFLTVFLAFVLEYIRRVREEPEEMAKLQSAWHRN